MASLARERIPLDDRLFPDFFVAFVLEALLLVGAFEAELRLVEARLEPFAAARFFVEAAPVFLVEVFLVLFLAPREVVDFFEADRPLLDFFAVDPLRAFVVGILSSVTPLRNTVNFISREHRPVTVAGCWCGIIRQRMRC